MIAAILLATACRATGSPGSDIVTWQAPTEIATGGGMKGPWQQNDSKYDFVDDPSVALGDDGAAYVVWVDHRDKDVHFRRDANITGKSGDGSARTSGTTSVNVSRSPATFSWLPRIVVAGKHVYVLWQEIVFSPGGSHGGEIFFARSTDGGATFEPPRNLSNSIEGDGKARITEKIWHNGSLDLARSPRGTLFAAWTNYDGALLLAWSDDGTQWSVPKQIAGSSTKPARAPSLAASNDTLYIAWTYGESTNADIHVASAKTNGVSTSKSDRAATSTPDRAATSTSDRAATSTSDRGTTDRVATSTTDRAATSRPASPIALGAPIVIATTSTYSDAPKLALDRAGTLHIAYAETEGDAFAKSRVVYMRSSDGARSFEPPRTISRGEASFPSLVVDGKTVVVAYERGSAAGERNARGLTVAISRDRGERFVEQAIDGSADREGFNGSQQGRLMSKLAAKSGKIAVVNSALRPNKSSRVWMIRGHLETSR